MTPKYSDEFLWRIQVASNETTPKKKGEKFVSALVR